MISIIDYGLGNVKAFANVYKSLNIEHNIARKSEDLAVSTRVILPGVGSFDYAITRLNESGMKETLSDLVLNKNIPVLGVCVGMQMLANSSDEGELPGLGWIDGSVKLFDSSKVKIPHMGWNTVKHIQNHRILKGVDSNSRFYFLHSFYFECRRTSDCLGVTDYSGEFTSIVNLKNVYGVQFHPEKSHEWGKKILENFAKL